MNQVGNSEVLRLVFIIVAIFWYLAASIAVGTVAQSKGRGAGAWFFVGFLLTPIFGVLLLIAAGSSQAAAGSTAIQESTSEEDKIWNCPQCGAINGGSSFTCSDCGYRLK